MVGESYKKPKVYICNKRLKGVESVSHEYERVDFSPTIGLSYVHTHELVCEITFYPDNNATDFEDKFYFDIYKGKAKFPCDEIERFTHKNRLYYFIDCSKSFISKVKEKIMNKTKVILEIELEGKTGKKLVDFVNNHEDWKYDAVLENNQIKIVGTDYGYITYNNIATTIKNPDIKVKEIKGTTKVLETIYKEE